ncbi:phage tail tape measure protein [Lacticaseibacillus paracasei]|uniref:Phage tail tape measure protein n=1 Tax=Lacticaseibacillus paracasei TaxID=1597 RepID=A0AAP4JLA2_LACPA|nr:phage tail tape measure protein [Lacticaseibacillus paracasei]MDM7455584.1 phage tail tape measure protein [Lacticaseibacillus paracasei]
MANVVATFTADIAPFQAAMGQISGSVKLATSSVQSTGQKVGTVMSGIGKASTVAGVAIGAMSVNAIKSYGDFQNSINKAAVIAGSSNKSLKGDMKDLETEALSLGKTLPISAEDAGNAMIEMARNGASIKDLKTEFPAIAKASAVAGADLAGTATTVQQAMNIWGGGAKNAAKDSAILALNANMSNAEVEDMGQAFANVGSTAATLGIGIKDTATAIGLMSNAGLGAAQGSQDLAHALTLMARPSKVAAGEMQELGITYTDAQGKFKPFPQILKEVAKATDGMSQSQKVAALTNLYGAAGAKAMLPLLIQTEKKTKSGKSGWDAYSDSLGKVSKTAKSANKYLSDNANNMTKNVGQSIAQMQDAFDAVVKTSIGTIAPQIKSVANALGDFATWLNKSKSPMAGFVKGLIAWSPVIAIVLVAFGLLSMAIGKLVKTISAPVKLIKGLGKAAGDTAKPMGASAGQIAAMGAKAAGAGLGIGLAAAGFALLAFAVAQLAKTGTDGLVALAAMTVSIVALMIVAKLVAPTFQKNAVGLIAFGAAMVLVAAGMAILVNSFSEFQSAGGNAAELMATIALSIGGLAIVFALVGPALNAGAIGMIAFGASILLVSAGLALLVNAFANFQSSGGNSNQLMITMAVSVGALALVFALLGPLLTAGAVGILAFGAAILLIGIGVALATNGIANLINAIANLNGASTTGKNTTNDFAKTSGSSLSVLGTNGSGSISSLAKNVTGSMSGMSSNGKGSANSLSNVVGSALGKMSSSGKNSGSSLASSLGGSFGQMSGKASSTTSSIRNTMYSLAKISLSAAGQAIMDSFLGGLKSKWNAITSFVGGIASWIKQHKGPISYDAKLLIPAGNAIMGGLNQGLQKSFGAVQKTVSGMASDISESMSANISNLSMAGTQFSSGDVTQSIDASERITPNIYVQNNVDKNGINSMVKEADANDAAISSYFRPIGG